MGIDYTPVGGIGLEITDEIKKKLVIANEGEAHDGCMDSLCSDLGLEYSEAGDGSYSGDENTFYLMVEGTTLMEINENSGPFLDKMYEKGIRVTASDLQVISELHVW